MRLNFRHSHDSFRLQTVQREQWLYKHGVNMETDSLSLRFLLRWTEMKLFVPKKKKCGTILAGGINRTESLLSTSFHRQCWLFGLCSVVKLCKASRTSSFLLSELEISFTCWSPTKTTTNDEDVFRAFDITLLKSKNTVASSRQWQHKHWLYHPFTTCFSSSLAFPTIFHHFPVNFWLKMNECT